MIGTGTEMDFDKIFIKDCNPTKMGGQAVLEGIMMRGADRMAIAVRREDGTINVRERPVKEASGWMKWPIIRGVVSFVSSLVTGTSTLMYSAEVLEEDIPEEEAEEPGRVEQWISNRFGPKAAFNFLLYTAVVIALVISIGVFVLLPTWIVGVCGKVISNAILLNLIEGVLRMVMFILYIVAISRMKDIQRVFQYHGAEHKTIHCYENGLELTPENCMKFERLHPRCGTSFLMFVLIISLLLFSFLGWPNLAFRILSRLLLIPVIAGVSYEVLRWAGRSDSIIVKILSVPGLLMQKITTSDPDQSQLEVAIVAVKACLMERSPEERIYDVDSQGNPVEREKKTEKAAGLVKGEEPPADFGKSSASEKTTVEKKDPRGNNPENPPSAKDPVTETAEVQPEKEEPSREEDPFSHLDQVYDAFAEEEGLWSGEKQAQRSQYLYDLGKIMNMDDVLRRSSGSGR